MGSLSNFKNEHLKNKNSSDMTKRTMNVQSKEELDIEFEDRIIDWTTFYR